MCCDLDRLVGGEARLALFGRHMHLQQAVHHPAGGPGGAVYRLQQMERIHRLDERRVGNHVLDLVGLQMAYEVPLDVGWERLGLGLQLQGTVLAETALPGLVGGHDVLHRLKLGNRHQRH